MNRISFYSLLLLASTTVSRLLVAQEAEFEKPQQNRPRAVTLIGKDFSLPSGQRAKEVVVIRGSANVEGTVERDLVIIGGDLDLNGRVNGELVVIAGTAKLGPQAEVRREAVVIGGDMVRDPAAQIGGDVVELLPNMGFFRAVVPMLGWVTNGLMLGRPMAPNIAWSWAIAGILLAFYCLMALLFKRPLSAGVEAVETRPLASFMAGVLVFLLIVPVLILLAVSVVGTLLIPFLLCGLVFAFFLGKAAVYQFVGFQFSSSLRTTTALSLLALLIGAGVFLLLYLVPFLGFFVWGLVTVWGIGAVTLAGFRSFRQGKSTAPAATTITFNPPAMAAPTPAASIAATPPVIGAAGTAPASVASTPQSPVTYALAGFWIRLLAMLLDFILVGGVMAVVHARKPFLLLFVWFVYHVGFWIARSMTIGDIIVGIQCVRTDGRPMNVAASIIRALASAFSLMAFGLGFFWAGWDRQKQSWHDKIAGTFMVKVPKGVSLV